MRGRLALAGMLGGSLTFLVGLYVPWASVTRCVNPDTRDCLVTFSVGGGIFDGWFSAFGGAAGLLAAAIAAVTAAKLAGRPVLDRFPLATGSLALLFFTVMNAAILWNEAQFNAGYDHSTAHLASGAYVGLAGAAVAVVSALGLPWSELDRVSASSVAGVGLALGLLATFLVQQLTLAVAAIPDFFAYDLSFENSVPAIGVCALALFGLPLLLRGGPASVRRAGAVAIAVLSGAYLVPFRGGYGPWPWELWLLLACAIALVALSIATGGRIRFAYPSVGDAAMVAAGTLLLVSLFLPWVAVGSCPPDRCRLPGGLEGWTVGYGGLAGTLVVLLLIRMLAYGGIVPELAIGGALFVLSTGLTIALAYTVRLAYAAPIGFAGAALLLVLAVRRVGAPRAHSPIGVVPIGACLGFLSFAVASTTRGGSTFEIQSPWQIFLLTAAAIVLTVRLLLRWWSGPQQDSEDVVLIPLGLLALTTLDLIWIRGSGISWEGWVSVFLCLLLAVCGWAERNGGLERLRIPEEIWRVDRLPPVED